MSQQSDKHAGHHNFSFFLNFIFEISYALQVYSLNLCSGNWNVLYYKDLSGVIIRFVLRNGSPGCHLILILIV